MLFGWVRNGTQKGPDTAGGEQWLPAGSRECHPRVVAGEGRMGRWTFEVPIRLSRRVAVASALGSIR